jgi:ribosomal protein S12 methylthiotransferase
LGVRHSTAAVICLGCPKNQVDSEQVLGSLAEAGYRLTSDPAGADLVVITTCAFLQSAVRESESVIRQMLALKRRYAGTRVVVAGCLFERYGDRLRERFPDIDLFVGLRDMPHIPQLLDSRARRRASSARHDVPRLLSTPSHFAYLKVADGCDNRCSFCMIPYIRGTFRSRPTPEILAEARGLADMGVKELILVAQDSTLYGTDIYGRPALARLLRRLSEIGGVRWLRLMYAHPAHLTEDVIDELATNPKLCRYIDLPIQHVSDRLLAKMNRPYRRQDLELLLETLRAIPDVHIRTTIIVGFPGETDAEFSDLVDFVTATRFDRLSAYAYSPEPGTPAYSFGPQVSVAAKRERVGRLMRAQAAVSRANLKRLVGRRLTVLVDSPGLGRAEWDAPEVDGAVKLTGRRVLPGQFVEAVVTGSSTHDIKAQVVKSATSAGHDRIARDMTQFRRGIGLVSQA